MNRLSSITQFKIEFLLPLTSCRKVLGKMPGTQFKIEFLLPLTSCRKVLGKMPGKFFEANNVFSIEYRT